MLTDDACYSMPPLPEWYCGTDEIRDFLIDRPVADRAVAGSAAAAQWAQRP
jgi:hypothetical protein